MTIATVRGNRPIGGKNEAKTNHSSHIGFAVLGGTNSVV